MSVETLKSACDAARINPSFQPKDGKTFCNLAAAMVAQAMGCGELHGLTADEMYAKISMNVSGHWTKVPGSYASQDALVGCLIFAAMSSAVLGEKHGHIAPLYPIPAEFSGSLNRFVPMVSNCGRMMGIMKSSAAFPVSQGEADYFLYG